MELGWWLAMSIFNIQEQSQVPRLGDAGMGQVHLSSRPLYPLVNIQKAMNNQ